LDLTHSVPIQSKEQQEFEDLVGALRKLPVAAFSDWSQGAATFVLQTECK